MAPHSTHKPFRWIGGHLALDFNNTVDWSGLTATEGELLTDVRRLVDWGNEADVLAPRDGRHLRSRVEGDPNAEQRVLDRTRAFRDSVHAIFYPLAQGEAAAAEHLQQLNALLASLPAQVEPVGSGGTYEWTSRGETDAHATLLWSVAWAAAQLLTSAELPLVKTCANERCGWLFVDRSRKHNRRWCEMSVCGNRAKARRFQKRKQGKR
ncbi:MAG TPA: CGNR zinc finger domain-containing protein [Gemmatimonadales bacterium]|jgi:predicted RNA-binding Zn ribbon-like protein